MPVHDPEAPLEHVARAVASQGIADDAYEMIFVLAPDAGDLADRADRLAQRLPQLQVLCGDAATLPAAAVRGGWVLTHDEYGQLAPGELRRMADLGGRSGAAAVLGASAPGVLRRLGDPPDRRATLADLPLPDSLDGPALLRRDLLAARGLTVPVGPVALAHALLCAGEVAVLGGGACYLRARADNDPASVLWAATDLLEVFPEVDGMRAALLRDVVDRAAGRTLLAYADGDRFRLLDAARRLVNDALPERLDALLPTTLRVRAALLREGRFADLADGLRAEAAVSAVAALTGAAWRPGALELDLLARLDHASAADRWPLPLPRPAADAVTPATRDAADGPAAGAVEVLLHHVGTGESVALPADVTVVRDSDGTRERVSFTIRARFGDTAATPPTGAAPSGGDAAHASGDWALASGRWRVRVRVELCGLRREVDVVPSRGVRWVAPWSGRLLRRGTTAGHRVTLTATAEGVVLRVRPPRRPPTGSWGR
ncbi:hypothetical protein GCM10009682_06260 [Luedemannella flava]|uniref:TarS/TarP linker domain-containing protein n=1 Tax=Luedemannella flava TaxID=349316 RepID=A0ABP4XL24_9ACTN